MFTLNSLSLHTDSAYFPDGASLPNQVLSCACTALISPSTFHPSSVPISKSQFSNTILSDILKITSLFKEGFTSTLLNLAAP